MKHLKMLGLAAIAAMVLMAFVGAGTASATTLFTDSAHTIKYPSTTTIHATLETGNSTVLKDTSNNTIAICTKSTIHGWTNSESATWIGSDNTEANHSTLTFEGCNQTTTVLAAGSAEIMWTSGESGTVVGKGSEVTLGIFGVTCTYGTGTGTTLGTLSSGTAPILGINAVLPKIAGGFLCPITGVWEARYIVTSPHALYITN